MSFENPAASKSTSHRQTSPESGMHKLPTEDRTKPNDTPQVELTNDPEKVEVKIEDDEQEDTEQEDTNKHAPKKRLSRTETRTTYSEPTWSETRQKIEQGIAQIEQMVQSHRIDNIVKNHYGKYAEHWNSALQYVGTSSKSEADYPNKAREIARFKQRLYAVHPAYLFVRSRFLDSTQENVRSLGMIEGKAKSESIIVAQYRNDRLNALASDIARLEENIAKFDTWEQEKKGLLKSKTAEERQHNLRPYPTGQDPFEIIFQKIDELKHWLARERIIAANLDRKTQEKSEAPNATLSQKEVSQEVSKKRKAEKTLDRFSEAKRKEQEQIKKDLMRLAPELRDYLKKSYPDKDVNVLMKKIQDGNFQLVKINLTSRLKEGFRSGGLSGLWRAATSKEEKPFDQKLDDLIKQYRAILEREKALEG